MFSSVLQHCTLLAWEDWALTNNRLSCQAGSEEWKAHILCWVLWAASCLPGPGWLGREVGVTTLADPRWVTRGGMTGSCHWLLRGTHSSPWLALGLPASDRSRRGSSSCHQHYESLSLSRVSATMFYHFFSLCFKSLTFLNSLSISARFYNSSLLFCTFCTVVQWVCKQDKLDSVPPYIDCTNSLLSREDEQRQATERSSLSRRYKDISFRGPQNQLFWNQDICYPQR